MIVEAIYTENQRGKKQKTEGEKLSRSILKSVSWRFLGTLDTVIISFFITGAWDFALTIGAIELVTKMGLYLIHERLWNHIQWGRK